MLNFFKKNKDESPSPEPKASWAERLKQGLTRTRTQLGNQLGGLFGDVIEHRAVVKQLVILEHQPEFAPHWTRLAC